LVSARTALVNTARGLTKSYGAPLPKCGSEQMNREIALLAEIESPNEPQLHISKEGDRYLRTLLVQGAH
jgi:hypothetical protein